MAFITLLVLAVLLGQVQTRARTHGTIDVVSSTLQKLTIPGIAALNNVEHQTDLFFRSVSNGPRDLAELKRLKQLEQSFKMYGQTVEGLQNQIDQLRKLSSMPNFGRVRIPGRIVGYFPYENRLTLSVGDIQGVKVGMPVVGAAGLIGIVQTVEKDKCQVLTVTSPMVRFGAMVQRDMGVAGIMKGQTPTRLVLDVLDTGNIEVGDPVITSGFSSRIPRGIPVGDVAEVVPDPNYGTRRVFVAPSSQIGPTVEVWILK